MFGAASASAAPAAAAGGAGASAGAGAEAGSGAAEGPVVLDDIKVTSEMKSAAQALLMSYEGDAAVADLAKFVATHGAAAATRALLSQALSVAAEKKAAYRPLAAKCLADGLARASSSNSSFPAPKHMFASFAAALPASICSLAQRETWAQGWRSAAKVAVATLQQRAWWRRRTTGMRSRRS